MIYYLLVFSAGSSASLNFIQPFESISLSYFDITLVSLLLFKRVLQKITILGHGWLLLGLAFSLYTVFRALLFFEKEEFEHFVQLLFIFLVMLPVLVSIFSDRRAIYVFLVGLILGILIYSLVVYYTVLVGVEKNDAGRYLGVYGSPNKSVWDISVVSMLAISLLLLFNFFSKIVQSALVTIIALNLFSFVILFQSRSLFIALCLTIMYVAWKLSWEKKFFVIGSFLALLVSLQLFEIGLMQRMFASVSDFQQGRLYQIVSAYKYFDIQHFLNGFGINKSADYTASGQVLHNLYAKSFFEGGIIYLFFVIFFTLGPLAWSFRHLKKFDSTIHCFYVLNFITFFTFLSFNSVFVGRQLWLGVGIFIYGCALARLKKI